MNEELKEARRVIAALLDHAVYDVERSDDCAAAVSDAHAVMRRRPNSVTIAAMQETTQ